MRKSKNGRALLLELMIVILFFGLCASVVLQSMVAVHQATLRTDEKRVALREVQTDMAILMLMDGVPVEEALGERGYTRVGTRWEVKRDEVLYSATMEEETTPAGVILKMLLQAQAGDEVLLTVPYNRYIPQGGE